MEALQFRETLIWWSLSPLRKAPLRKESREVIPSMARDWLDGFRCHPNIYIIYIYKVVISVCLFVFPIITQEPLYRFASNFGWGTWENHGNVLAWFLD